MQGIWTVLITPFNQQDEIDFSSLKKILHDQIDAQVDGVVINGTTSESPVLKEEERKALITFALKETRGTSVKVVAGTGSNNTHETLVFSKWASDQGVDGVMLVTPYYNKPTQAGLEAHYRKIADQVSCPVILYNVPGRTGVSLTAETVTQLASHPRIKALKEASGNISFASEILDQLALSKQKLDLLSGDDATYLPFLSVGGVGAISVVSNLFPRAMVAIHKAFHRGDVKEAQKIHSRFYPLFKDLFIESNPIPIKYAMSHMGWCEPHLRLPLTLLSPVFAEKLKKTLARCGLERGTPS